MRRWAGLGAAGRSRALFAVRDITERDLQCRTGHDFLVSNRRTACAKQVLDVPGRTHWVRRNLYGRWNNNAAESVAAVDERCLGTCGRIWFIEHGTLHSPCATRLPIGTTYQTLERLRRLRI